MKPPEKDSHLRKDMARKPGFVIVSDGLADNPVDRSRSVSETAGGWYVIPKGSLPKPVDASRLAVGIPFCALLHHAPGNPVHLDDPRRIAPPGRAQHDVVVDEVRGRDNAGPRSRGPGRGRQAQSVAHQPIVCEVFGRTRHAITE